MLLWQLWDTGLDNVIMLPVMDVLSGNCVGMSELYLYSYPIAVAVTPTRFLIIIFICIMSTTRSQ